jgi:hypothetical protein
MCSCLKKIRNNYLNYNIEENKEDSVCFQYYKKIGNITLIGKNHSKILKSECLTDKGVYLFEIDIPNIILPDGSTKIIIKDDRGLLPPIYWEFIESSETPTLNEVIIVVDKCLDSFSTPELIRKRNKYLLEENCEKLLYDTFSTLLEDNIIREIKRHSKENIIFIGGVNHCENILLILLTSLQ